MGVQFRNREDAAGQLCIALGRYRGHSPLVLAIPRGGVPIGRIVADVLGGELDVVLVRKIGAPSNPEFAIGAVDERGTVSLNEDAELAGADAAYVEREARRQLETIRERRRRYGAGRASIPVNGRTVIVVDDGLATGATMIAALDALRAQHPGRLVCAVPVASPESLSEVRRHADDIVCLATPMPFRAVGLYYRDFAAVEDDEVIAALGASPPASRASERVLRIPVDGVQVDGDLVVPESPLGVVLFAHGSGSSRHSARNRHVARVLQRHGVATLLVDLLTPAEDIDPDTRFDIPLLAWRLQAALLRIRGEPGLGRLPIGLFGASTGAAAAISVAAQLAGEVAAVVSRGGRPDLAPPNALSRVRTPTLLIVGGEDRHALNLNRAAQAAMGPWAELIVVPGATHLFEEAGALSKMAEHANAWFVRHFREDAQAGVETLRA